MNHLLPRNFLQVLHSAIYLKNQTKTKNNPEINKPHIVFKDQSALNDFIYMDRFYHLTTLLSISSGLQQAFMDKYFCIYLCICNIAEQISCSIYFFSPLEKVSRYIYSDYYSIYRQRGKKDSWNLISDRAYLKFSLKILVTDMHSIYMLSPPKHRWVALGFQCL